MKSERGQRVEYVREALHGVRARLLASDTVIGNSDAEMLSQAIQLLRFLAEVMDVFEAGRTKMKQLHDGLDEIENKDEALSTLYSMASGMGAMIEQTFDSPPGAALGAVERMILRMRSESYGEGVADVIAMLNWMAKVEREVLDGKSIDEAFEEFLAELNRTK